MLAIPVEQASATSSVCASTDSAIDYDFGTNIPVVLIHGIGGSPVAWESPGGSSICNSVNQIADVSVALNFGYTGFDWGTTSARLIPLVKQISDRSIANGGRGKVVVIAYSLGTVIIRDAFSADRLPSEVGQVITIAAPNQNTWENYPSSVAVHAIAGNIVNHIVRGNKTSSSDTQSDGLIGVSDALLRSTNGPGGGAFQATCIKTYRGVITDATQIEPTDILCDHGNLLKNNHIKDDVVTALTAYVNSLPPIVPQRSYTVDNALTIHPDAGWGDPKPTAVSPDGWEITHTADGILVGAFSCTDVMKCVTFSGYLQLAPGTPPAISIGGKTSDLSFIVNQPGNPVNVWCFSSYHVCVYGKPGLSTPTADVQTLFATAEWLY